MRFTALWLAGALVTLAAGNDAPGGAPVPKHLQRDNKPAKLTPEILAGKWSYQWGSSLEGWIEFDAEKMTYTAQHSPNSTTYYHGSFSVGDGCITIVEMGWDTQGGRGWGPQVYRFDVDVKGWPVLAGKTTSGYGFDVQQIPEATMHLKLSDRK